MTRGTHAVASQVCFLFQLIGRGRQHHEKFKVITTLSIDKLMQHLSSTHISRVVNLLLDSYHCTCITLAAQKRLQSVSIFIFIFFLFFQGTLFVQFEIVWRQLLSSVLMSLSNVFCVSTRLISV